MKAPVRQSQVAARTRSQMPRIRSATERGMRVVESEADLQAAVESAAREAGSSFGDDTVFLEKWLDTSRHVEIQIIGDSHGNLVHCFERECSIQRRHQKVIEEAPSPVLSESLRNEMGQAAVAAVKQTET